MKAETNPIGNQDIWVRSYKYSKAYVTCIESQNGKDMRNLADQAGIGEIRPETEVPFKMPTMRNAIFWGISVSSAKT